MTGSNVFGDLPQHVAERSKEKAILLALWRRPAFTTEISQVTGVKRYNLYFHLRKLEDDGLVLRERVGRMDRFRINEGRRERIAELLANDRDVASDPNARSVLYQRTEESVQRRRAPKYRDLGMISAFTSSIDYDEGGGHPVAEVVVRTLRMPDTVEGRNVIADALTRLGLGDEVEGVDIVDHVVVIGRRFLD